MENNEYSADGGAKGKKVVATSKKVKLGEATRIVYKGPRGAEYVKDSGKLVPAKKAVAAAAKKASKSKSKRK